MQVVTVTRTITARAFIINQNQVVASVSDTYQISHDYYENDFINQKNRLTLARCRTILGDEYKQLSDEQIDQIRIFAEMLADMTIESFLKQKKTLKPTENQVEEVYNGK